jgi:hypothetical protein
MTAGETQVAPVVTAEDHGDARRNGRLVWRMVLAVFLVTTFVFSISPVITNYDSY